MKAILKTAAALSLVASTSFAGGLENEIVEVAPTAPAEATGSIGTGTILAAGALALLLLAASESSSDT